jgi:hypothetical protein
VQKLLVIHSVVEIWVMDVGAARKSRRSMGQIEETVVERGRAASTGVDLDGARACTRSECGDNLFTYLLFGYLKIQDCFNPKRIRIQCHKSWCDLVNYKQL